jgi:hypothetical protein
MRFSPRTAELGEGYNEISVFILKDPHLHYLPEDDCAFSANGAVSLLTRRGEFPNHIMTSAEGAIQKCCHSSRRLMNRAFSARHVNINIPGALPQATDDAAPLALNRWGERKMRGVGRVGNFPIAILKRRNNNYGCRC